MDPPVEHLQGAFVGLHQAEEDVHQGGLAGAVLAQDRMNLARIDIKIHMVKSQHPGVALGDAPGGEDGFRGRCRPPPHLRMVIPSRSKLNFPSSHSSDGIC